MGIGLKLIFLRDQTEIVNDKILVRDTLELEADRRIFDQFESPYRVPTVPVTITPQPLPPRTSLVIYDDEGEVRHNTDPYGSPLTFVFVRELRGLHLPINPHLKNIAIKAFIDALPVEIHVILWWK